MARVHVLAPTTVPCCCLVAVLMCALVVWLWCSTVGSALDRASDQRTRWVSGCLPQCMHVCHVCVLIAECVYVCCCCCCCCVACVCSPPRSHPARYELRLCHCLQASLTDTPVGTGTLHSHVTCCCCHFVSLSLLHLLLPRSLGWNGVATILRRLRWARCVS